MDRSRIAIIIPAYNEGTTIAAVVKGVFEYGIPIVVDDGSADETAKIAKKAGAEVISHKNNLGYDAALNSGFSHADTRGFDLLVTIDADGQHQPTLIPTFIEKLRNGADMVIGIRDSKPRLSEHFFSLISRILWNMHDPLCGIKGYKIELYKTLGYFDSYDSIGTELAIFAARQRMKIIQIPILTLNRADKPRFGSKLNANIKILRAIFRAFF